MDSHCYLEGRGSIGRADLWHSLVSLYWTTLWHFICRVVTWFRQAVTKLLVGYPMQIHTCTKHTCLKMCTKTTRLLTKLPTSAKLSDKVVTTTTVSENDSDVTWETRKTKQNHMNSTHHDTRQNAPRKHNSTHVTTRRIVN